MVVSLVYYSDVLVTLKHHEIRQHSVGHSSPMWAHYQTWVNSRTLSTRPRPRTIEIVLEDPRGQGHVLEDSITDCWRTWAKHNNWPVALTAWLDVIHLARNVTYSTFALAPSIAVDQRLTERRDLPCTYQRCALCRVRMCSYYPVCQTHVVCCLL